MSCEVAPLNFTIRPLTAADARAIAGWHYDGPYSFYDMDQDPDDLAELLDPANWPERYQAAVDEQGLGLAFLQAGLRHAERAYHPTCINLAVAAFNRRAIRLYEKAGFRTVGRRQQATNGGIHEFITMSR